MSVVIPSLRGAIAVPGWAKNELWRDARAVPSLDLRFANNKSLVDAVTGASLVTFTRASSGTFVDSAGVIQTAATDVPRFDHNPTTGESLGLLVEEQRTNSIRNNTMVGAVAGTPGTLPTNWGATTTGGGLTRQIVEIGTVNGINYIRFRITGTTNASSVFFNVSTFDSTAASTGQTWTVSAYYRLQAGSLTGVTLQHELARFGPSYLGSTVLPFTLGSGLLSRQRYSLTSTVSDATLTGINYGFQLLVPTNGTVVDFTVDIGLPQLEQGAFATSPIPTSTAAVTRSADVASITGSAFSSWYRQDEGTVFAEAALAQPNSGGNQFIFRANDNSFNNNTTINIQSSGFASIATAAGGVFDGAATNAIALTANVNQRTAGGYAANNLGASLNGGTVTVDTTATMPTALNRLDIGSDHNGTNRVRAGTIKRIAFWPQRLSNSTLQAITQ